ncbi:unnamed protein product [Absidia cylindrospora]
MSLDTIWHEIYDHQGGCSFYVNQKTGNWRKNKPTNASIVKVDPDSIWSVWSDTAQMTLYYYSKTNKWTSHTPPPYCPVVSLPVLAKKPSLRKYISIPTIASIPNQKSFEQPYDKYADLPSPTSFNHTCQNYPQFNTASYEDTALSNMHTEEQQTPSPPNVSTQKVKKQGLLLQTAKASIESNCRSKIFPQSFKHQLTFPLLHSYQRSTLTNGSGTSPPNIKCCPCASSKPHSPKAPSPPPSLLPPLSPSSLSPPSLSFTLSPLSPLSPSSPFSPATILSPFLQCSPSSKRKGSDNNIYRSAFEHYAATQFNIHKRGIFKRTPIPLDEMAHWIKYSINKPLLKTTNKNHTKDALASFKKIQTIMGDRPRKYHGRLCTCDDVKDIQSILMCGITKGQHIRDEIYVQLCKQLNHNPSPTSTQKGWELLVVLCSTFPPSKDLAPCIIQFVEDHSIQKTTRNHDDNDDGGNNNDNSNPPSHSSSFASYISLKIKGVYELVPRESVPSRAEIQLARMATLQQQQQHKVQEEKGFENEIGKTVFGTPLDIIMENQQRFGHTTADQVQQLKIPRIVPLLIRAIGQLDGHSTEGVFRIPGLADMVSLLKTQINSDHVLDGGHEFPSAKDLNICGDDPNVPASLLRLWLRELPTPLIPESYYERCINEASSLDSVISIVDSLPDVNRSILLYTIGFLQEFLSPDVCKLTLMTVDSLTIVFAPNFFRAPLTDDLALALQKSKLEQLFVKTLLLGPKAASSNWFENSAVFDDLDTLFSVEYKKWYKVVTNHAANQKYALVCCGQYPTGNKDFELQQYDAVINIPVKTVGVNGAFNVLPFLDLLHLQDTVQVINGYEDVTSPCYANVTKEQGDVDIVFVATDEIKTGRNNIVFSANDNQLAPLAKASWLLYVSLFFNKEKEAMEALDIIQSQYNCHKSNLSKTPKRSPIAWTFYRQGEWHIYNERYFEQLSKDAGSTLVVPSVPIQFHSDIHGADKVIDQTDLAKDLPDSDATYQDWLNTGKFEVGTASFDQPFIHQNAVYRVDGLVDEKGFFDWTQRAAARPDLALTDIIHLNYPLYDRSYQYVWLRNFAKMDHVRTLSPSTYSCTYPLASMKTCKPQHDLFAETGLSLRHPGNVGLTLGILLTCGLVAGGVAFYRNRRQTKVEYFPLSNFS